MRFLLCLAVLVVNAAAGSVGFAAETKPAAEKNASASSLVGTFVGKWTTDTSEGQMRLKLKQVGATWSADSSFTLEATEIPTELVSLKVEGSKIELVLKWTSQGNTGQTRLVGALAREKLEGTFQSKIGEDTVEGTWIVTRT